MNRGDFGPVHLPKMLKIVAPGCYQILNGCGTSPGVAGFALGTFATSPPPALYFTIPPDVMTQLKNEGLVSESAIALYDDDRDPFESAANMPRYLALLQRLATVQVSDGA